MLSLFDIQKMLLSLLVRFCLFSIIPFDTTLCINIHTHAALLHGEQNVFFPSVFLAYQNDFQMLN